MTPYQELQELIEYLSISPTPFTQNFLDGVDGELSRSQLLELLSEVGDPDSEEDYMSEQDISDWNMIGSAIVRIMPCEA